ncbi:xylulose kinase [Arthrobacter pityocampae]|uniref:Xylulose kinase n=1 Tax=Arthrobacter pityocampae TaxID=547334 RepID=A0A2S5IX94_9MICC|nr:FGGY family carbohydrate kinase [Arthrobacter pityocampae]PPB49164.1 xylulose kinase [Arthrobacter pityocampae]
MALVAGVDSSTQSCKVVVLDAVTGSEVRSGRALHPEGTEVDPEAWWQALRAALEAADGLGADVDAVAIAGQQHGMVLIGQDGRVLRDALLWNDTRSADAARDLIGELGLGEIVVRTGSAPVASFTGSKVRWVRDAEPDVVPVIAAVALPHDWLTWRLRGFGPAGESPLGPVLDELVTDRSDASGTGYWSPAAEGYDLPLFEHMLGRPAREARGTQEKRGAGDLQGTDPDAVVLPRVLRADQAAGTVHASFTASGDREIVVGAGAGDNAGAALGLGAEEGDVVVSLGTSGTVFAVAADAVADPGGTVAGFADASGLFLPLVATLNAARVLSSVAGLLDVDHDGLAELALSAGPGSDGVVLVPYFEGERTPNLPTAKASVHNLSIASATRPNLARAAIEGMLCGLADALDAVRATGVRPRHLLLIGGAAQNAAVQEVTAQVFDLPVRIPAPGEYVARGAAVQAAWVLAGSRPSWTPDAVEDRAADHRPVIREQYRAAVGSLRF